jgi:putative transposase
MKPTALRFLVLTVAGWLQRRREEYIAYLLAENAVYKEHFAKRGLRLTDAQRLRLAVKGKAVGRAGLRQLATIGTPDTILRSAGSGVGRPMLAAARPISISTVKGRAVRDARRDKLSRI